MENSLTFLRTKKKPNKTAIVLLVNYLRGLMIPLTSWRMGMIRFLLGSMCSAFAASCVEQRGAPTKVQN